MPVTLVSRELERPFSTLPVGNLPPVSGTVRLVGARDLRAFYGDELPGLKLKKLDPTLAESHLYARCIRTWDVVLPDGTPAPVTPENVALLPLDVWQLLAAVVSGAAADAETVRKNSGTSSPS